MSDLSPIKFKRSNWNRVKHQGELLEVIYRVQVSSRTEDCAKVECRKPIRRRSTYIRLYWPKQSVMKKFHPKCFIEDFQPDEGIVNNASRR